MNSQSEWTMKTLYEHMTSLLAAERELALERDRRYAEVRLEQEKALIIKEKADEKALELARTIQIYKDEKANELREQINRERGTYINREEYSIQFLSLSDKVEASLKPLQDFMASQQGQRTGSLDARSLMLGVLIVLAGLIGAISPHIH